MQSSSISSSMPVYPGAPTALLDQPLDLFHPGRSPPHPPEQRPDIPQNGEGGTVREYLVRAVERPAQGQREHDDYRVDEHEPDDGPRPPAERERAGDAVGRAPLDRVGDGDQ